MSHTNETQHYQLPQFIGTDILNPLTDTNGAYAKIDETMYEVAETARLASESAQTAVTTVGEMDARVHVNEQDITALQTAMAQTRNMLADQFDINTEYAVGDCCVYDDKLWQFVNAHHGAWDATDVANRDLEDVIKHTFEGKLIRGEELIYTHPSPTGLTINNILVDLLNYVMGLYINRPANVTDVIIDGIDGCFGKAYFNAGISLENVINNNIYFDYARRTQTKASASMFDEQQLHVQLRYDAGNSTWIAVGTRLQTIYDIGSGSGGQYPLTNPRTYYRSTGDDTFSASNPCLVAYHYEYIFS